MGCSPSKGTLFSMPGTTGPQKALLDESLQDSLYCRPVEDKYLKTDEKENALLLLPEECPSKDPEWSQLSSNTTAAQTTEENKETDVNFMPQQIVSEAVQTDKIKKMDKRKKNKGKRKLTEKPRNSSIIQTKVDFPPLMVRAHQAAYAFLNPNICKYETLLGMLDQAAQTQLLLQSIMSDLLLCFEEINQALEEMAEEGELMLKEHGDYMALPSGMIGPAVIQAESSNDTANPPDPPPDLLQQLLQQSTEKIKLVGGSVQALGDTTLEEAVVYWSSLSKRLVEKLHTKQAAEQRLTQVLERVEEAAMRKSNIEDLALHSEDSGIGVENDSLTGSERHRHHCRSSGSGSCESGVNIHGVCDNLHNNLSKLLDHDEEDEEEEDDEEYEYDEVDRPERKRSNSSPPDPSHPLLYMHANYTRDCQATVKRPMTAFTATKPEHSSSTRCVNIMMELKKSQRDLDQQMIKLAEIQRNKKLAGPHFNLHRAGARKGSLRTNQSPSCLSMLQPQPPKHQSVRRLINTFSQGIDGRSRQTLANIPLQIRRPKTNGNLRLSDRVNGNEAGLVINGNNNNSRWPDGRYDLNVDNLPPPPPEVLMDNSFQCTEVLRGNEEGQWKDLALPVINQKTGVSRCLKTGMQNVDVLPNRGSMRQNAVVRVQDGQQQLETDVYTEIEMANPIYLQAHKIIPLHNVTESSARRNISELSGREALPVQVRMGHTSESSEFYEGEMSFCSLTVTAPPVSRVRLPPSCPSVRHRFPSPPVFRPQSTSRSSSRPSSPRIVARTTENNTEEIIPSVSFHDARSVFCQNEFQSSQTAISPGIVVLPRLSGEVAQGKLPMRRIDSSTRLTHSEQRPSLISHSEFYKDGSSATTQAKGSAPVTKKYRPDSPQMPGDNIQLDPNAAVMIV